jgi:hypothetical protein
MREGDFFPGEPVRINHRFDSSRLNLAYEGLLLVMWDEGREEYPDEAPPYALTFAHILIINIFDGCFKGRSNPAQRGGSDDPHLSGDV